jgi:uncharacterized protein
VARRLQRFLALSLLGSLSSLTLAAHAAAPIWAVRGAHGTVYLAGSMHMLPADDAALPKAFDRVYADSSRVVMEMDLGKFDPMEASTWMMDHGSLPNGTRLRTVLGDQRYQRLAAVAADVGLDMAGVNGLAPWVVGMELTDLAYTHYGFDSEQGVEEQLLRRTQADGKQTGGLESFQDELGGLVALSNDDQIKMLDQTMDELKDVQSEMHEILVAWRSGDTAHLAKLLSSEYDSFPALYKPLVTDRNARWMPQIEQLLKDDKNTLVVVGSLHLVGPGGLLELLKKDGFRPTQLN